MSRHDYERRAAANDKSRNTAKHNREEWLQDEDALLLTWNGSEEELTVMGEILGRTREACRQRFYLVRREAREGRTSRPDRPSAPVAPATPTCPRCGLQHVGEC